MQLKYSNYVAFSHDHGFVVNNSGSFYYLYMINVDQCFIPIIFCMKMRRHMVFIIHCYPNPIK